MHPMINILLLMSNVLIVVSFKSNFFVKVSSQMRMADTSGDNQVPLVSKQIYLGNIPLDVDEGQLTNIVREKIGSRFQSLLLTLLN